MLSIIKTAIITIIISFISGVLLDTYKNLAPRIVCSIGKGIPIRLSSKKFRAYTLTVRNISNKTIHDLTLNVQGHYDNLKVDDAKITRGLKFDASNEDNIYCVNIPFLSKDDEFSVKLFVEKVQGTYKKPVVTLRSPENFKKIESDDQNGFMASLLNVPENIGRLFRKKNGNNAELDNKGESSFNNKKVVATIVSIILIIFVAVFGVQHYIDNKKVASEVKTNSSQKVENSSNPSSNASKSNTQNKQATEKNNNSNSSASESGKDNTSSEAKSTTPSSNKSNQSVDKSKLQSDEDESNSKTESSSQVSEETKNKSTDSSTSGSNEDKGETKNSSESKSQESKETKTQESKSSNNESGGSETTTPSETKTN